MFFCKLIINCLQMLFLSTHKCTKINCNLFFVILLWSFFFPLFLKKEILIGNFPFLLKTGLKPKNTKNWFSHLSKFLHSFIWWFICNDNSDFLESFFEHNSTHEKSHLCILGVYYFSFMAQMHINILSFEYIFIFSWINLLNASVNTFFYWFDQPHPLGSCACSLHFILASIQIGHKL